MIKKLLSIIALGLTSIGIAQQNFVVSDAPVRAFKPYNHNSVSGISAKTSAVGPCMDSILYQDYKTFFKATPANFLALSAITNSLNITCSYAFKNSGTVTVQGLGVLALRKTGSPSPTIPTKIYLYNVNASFQPTTLIDSVTVSVGLFNYYYGALSSPKTLTANFAVAAKNVSTLTTDTLQFALTRAQTAAAATNKFGEALGYYRQGGVWYAANAAFGGTNDYEPVTTPIISYSIAANFSTPSTVCVGGSALFTNTSTNHNVIINPQFNLGPFAQMWGVTSHTALTGLDSAYTWVYGDGTTNGHRHSVTHSHTYAGPAGTMNDSLFSVMVGYSGNSFCADFLASTINVLTCTGINELSANNQIEVYPNPSTGIVNIKNLILNSEIEVVNILGQSVYKTKADADDFVADLNSLSNGTYFIKISTVNEKTKIIKWIRN